MSTGTGTNGWSFADVWDTVAAARPDAPALAHGERRENWATFERRAASVAATLAAAGLERGDKVALYLPNAPEYMEGAYATLKAGLVPVNTNYRYVQDELLYLWTNADVAAVVFHGSFTATIEDLRKRCPLVRLWVHVDDGSASCPAWAMPYEDAASADSPCVRAVRRRSDLDLYRRHHGAAARCGCGGSMICSSHPTPRAIHRSPISHFVRARLNGPFPVGLPGCAVDARDRLRLRHDRAQPRGHRRYPA